MEQIEIDCSNGQLIFLTAINATLSEMNNNLILRRGERQLSNHPDTVCCGKTAWYICLSHNICMGNTLFVADPRCLYSVYLPSFLLYNFHILSSTKTTRKWKKTTHDLHENIYLQVIKLIARIFAIEFGKTLKFIHTSTHYWCSYWLINLSIS